MMHRFVNIVQPYAIALAATGLAVGLRWLMAPLLQDSFRTIFVYGAVAFAVWRCGLGPAVMASLLGYAISNYLFMGDRYAFHFSVELTVGFLAYLFSCGMLIGLGWATRRANLRTREGDRTLQTTLDSIVDAVIATNKEGRITRLNGAAAALTGWPMEEAVGQRLLTVFRAMHKSTQKSLNPVLNASLTSYTATELPDDAVLTALDGQQHFINGRVVPVTAEHKSGGGCLLAFRDVTEQRTKAEQLANRERELSEFFDNAVFGIHWLDGAGRILRANQAELDLLGYSREEYVGRPIADFHVDQAITNDMLHRVRNGEVMRDRPAQLRRKDGGIEHVLISCNAQFDENGFVHSSCFTRAITDRKEAEETRARLAAIVTASGDAIISKSLDGIVQSWNAGAERLLGYSEEEMIGSSIYTVIPPELYHEEVSILSRIRRGERVRHFDTVRMTKEGRRIDLSITVSPVFDESGNVIGASKVARDITERKQTEAALQEADHRKDEFLATLAHELRNPLAPISHSLDILKHAEHSPDLVRESHVAIERQLTHMVRLVDDLLNVSRISRDKLTLRTSQVDLASIIEQALETARPLIADFGHNLEVEAPHEPIYLKADPVRLIQVLSNLLNNACKYTPRHGHICLTVEQHTNEVSIAVKDNGVGIEQDQLEAVFDMFKQVDHCSDQAMGGLGIGLTLARRLVEMHGGRITAFSEGPNRGSEFTVHLPVLAQIVAETPVSSSEKPDVATAQRILVVDDNLDSAHTLSVLLELMGHQVELAHDGEAAVEAAEHFRPALMLLDIGLPKLDGYGACRRIRKQPWGTSMRIAALTGWGQEEDQRRSSEAGFDAHLVKPVNYEAVRRLLEKPSAETG